MKQNINFGNFYDAFKSHGRMDQFTYNGLQILFDYLEDFEGSSCEEIELDVVALCCEFYESEWEDVATDYSIDLTGIPNDDRKDVVREYLAEKTIVCGETENAIIYGAF